MATELPRVMFLYWGRRGLSHLALEMSREALASRTFSATVSVSRHNDCYTLFSEFGEALVPINTFRANTGAILQSWRIPSIRRQLLQHIDTVRPQVVIELIPHVWSSFVAPAIKAAGVRYVTIVHDAVAHSGDYRSSSIQWLAKRTLSQADLILALSGAVAGRIETMGDVPRNKIFTLFHPDLDFGVCRALETPKSGTPIRLGFFGRIMPYKGLPLFIDMVEQLQDEGIAVEVGVFGEGMLGSNARRLRAIGAEVINRWLSEAEISVLLPRFHAIVLSHIEASQSGIAAMAFGAGLPVIATPVGGLIEQVQHDVNGVLATRADGFALAEAAKRLLFDPPLYSRICCNLAATKTDRSVARFVDECVSHALYAGDLSPENSSKIGQSPSSGRNARTT